jgi:exonuclease III
MSDLTSSQLPVLQKTRLPGLDLPSSLIQPAYQGRSIVNIPSSICRWLGAEALFMPTLDEAVTSELASRYQRVMVVLMDGLALHRLQQWMGDGTAPVWGRLAEQGVLAPLTSISPSTTSAALTALWTGRPAAQHGITGYEMWMREYGAVVNTILQSPMSFRTGRAGSLEHAGFKPEEYLPFINMGKHLKQYGVNTYVKQHYTIAHSGLSRMFMGDAQIESFSTAVDLWIDTRKLIEQKPHERMYLWVYWGEVDHLGHVYGPDGERVAAEFHLFSYAFEKFFLNALPDALRQDTLVILTADHGQVHTENDDYYNLLHHPELTRRLHIHPTGEHRLTFLHIRPGQTEAVREYIQRAWPNQFIVINSAYAMECGLFGPAPHHPDLLNRVGDDLVIALGEAYWWWGGKDNPLLGRHGGLTPKEMLVPFLAAAL